SSIGQCALVLVDKHYELLSHAIWHFNKVHDSPDCVIAAHYIFDLFRKIAFNRSLHAPIEKLSRLSTIKKSVQIRSLIKDINITPLSRGPFDEVHEPRGMRL